jgi:hypothetical protein
MESMEIDTLTELGKIWQSMTIENSFSLGPPSPKSKKLYWHTYAEDLLHDFETPHIISNIKYSKVKNIFLDDVDITLGRLSESDCIIVSYIVKNRKKLKLMPPFGTKRYLFDNLINIKGFWFIKLHKIILIILS